MKVLEAVRGCLRRVLIGLPWIFWQHEFHDGICSCGVYQGSAPLAYQKAQAIPAEKMGVKWSMCAQDQLSMDQE